ncbi:MAG: hypothetical protein OHK005_15490 [Candidatus Methylacidiphilales bacterium]
MSDRSSGFKVLGVLGKIFVSLFLSLFLFVGIFTAWSVFKDGFPGWGETVFLAVFLLFFLGIPGAMLVAIWLVPPTRRGPDLIAPDRSLTETVSKSTNGNMLIISLGTVFALAGLVTTGIFSIPIWTELAGLSGYVATPATVLSSEVRTHSGDNVTYSVHIRYRYEVGGITFESDRYDLMNLSSSGRADKDKIVQRYPPGASFTCYVAPTQPELAVIRNDWQWIYLFTGIPPGAVLIGLCMVIGALRRPLLNPQGVSAEDVTALNVPIQLKPKQTAGGAVFGALLFALFWNGIIGVFIWQIIEGFRSGQTDWFLVLFSIPFVLIGLGLIGAVIYSAAAFWNPRFDLRVTGPVTLGRPFRLEWRCLGSTNRLAALHLTLIGQEVQIYVSGSGKNRSKRVERSTFHRKPLINTQDRYHFSGGVLEIPLPSEGVMPTLTGQACRIEWTLELRGRIRHWPDVAVDYPLNILPFPTRGRQ